MARAKIDELNILSEDIQESSSNAPDIFDYHDFILHYFDPMQITEAQKKKRIEAAEEILKRHKDAVILFLTTFSDDEYIVKALKLGVRGYLLKQDYKSLPAALKAAMNGQSVFGGAVVDKLPALMNKASSSESEFDYESKDITEKEFEVIQLVAEGYSNKEIAGKLFLSEGTVRNYLSTILEKLELRDRTQLAIFYLKNHQ